MRAVIPFALVTELDVLNLIVQALRLEASAFATTLRLPEGLQISLAVVFLAGLSQGLGQSVVLFANRVRPRRFIASLVVSGALYVSGFFFLVASIWLVARYGIGQDRTFDEALRAVGLAYAPYLFGFFSLTPYLGNAFAILLSLWSLAALFVALRVALGLNLIQAVVCSALGWLLLQVAQRTVGRPIRSAARSLRQRVAGRPLERNLRQLFGQKRNDK